MFLVGMIMKFVLNQFFDFEPELSFDGYFSQ